VKGISTAKGTVFLPEPLSTIEEDNGLYPYSFIGEKSFLYIVQM
jgi:hypothetical protein